MKTGLLLFLIFALPSEPFTEGPLRNWEKEDKMALSITIVEARSVSSMVEKIKTFKTDEWGKFRIAFRWITEHIAYDYASYKSGNIKSVIPNETIKTKKAICQGYADLLKAIADGLGIKCEIVIGYSKGGGYKEGDQFTDTNHAWNAARFDGKWYLFDATWAAGFVDMNGNGHYYKRFERFYFAPLPEEFIFGHLPADSKWQLTPDTISLAEFEKRIDIQVPLFRMGMSTEALHSICPTLQQCDLVQVNPIPTAITIEKVTIPFEKTLSDGKLYSFTIAGPKGSEFFIINEKNTNNLQKKDGVLMWDENMLSSPIAMVYKKGIYKATLTVKSGDLAIYAKANGKKNYIFIWKVK